MLDGRGNRLKATIDASVTESESALAKVNMYDESVVLNNKSKADRMQIGRHIAEYSKIIAKVESQTKLVSDRVEKSSNATLLSAEFSKHAQVRANAKAMAT